MQKFEVTLTEKMGAGREDIEKIASVMAESPEGAIQAATAKLYGKAARFDALGMVGGTNVTDRGQVWRREKDDTATRVTGMVWAEVVAAGK